MFDKIDTQESMDIESWPCDLGDTWPDLGDFWKGLTLAVRWSTPFISLPCPSSCFILFSKSHYLKPSNCLRNCKVIILCSIFRSIWFFWLFAPAQPPNENTFTHKASHKRGFCSTCFYVWTLQEGACDPVHSVCWEAEFLFLYSLWAAMFAKWLHNGPHHFLGSGLCVGLSESQNCRELVILFPISPPNPHTRDHKRLRLQARSWLMG